MATTMQRLTAIAMELPAEAQHALLAIAESLVTPPRRFFDTMSDAERADLQQSLAEADCGDVADQAQLDSELDELFAAAATPQA